MDRGIVASPMPELDRVNLTGYQKQWVIRRIAAMSVWLDKGKEKAVALVADRVRDLPVLDVGVGGGGLRRCFRR